MTAPEDPVVEQTFELEPVPTVLSGMPSPSQFKATLLQAINEGYQTLADARGPVTDAESTYEIQRRIAGSLEKCADFKSAFAAAETLLKQYAQEELVAAVNEQDGVPTQGLTVPDRNGDVRIGLDTKNTYDIDVDTLQAAVAAGVVGFADHPGQRSLTEQVVAIVEGDDEVPPDQLGDVLGNAMIQAQRVLTSCGKFDAQVTKVNAYAASLARDGADNLAAAIAAAVVKRTEYKGIKVTRKAAK